MPEPTYLGSSPPRPDALAKVTGAARFATDLVLPRMLHAAILGSPHAHARVKSIDASGAVRMPGVVAVVTARDIPGTNQIGVIKKDHPCLVEDRARYVGDAVALVAAEHPDLAHEACERIRVEYEVLEPILDPEAARFEDANRIHEGGNVPVTLKVRKGDVEAGFAEADEVVEATFTTGAQEHMYLEPIACLAEPKPDGSIVVSGSCQCPYYLQLAIANVLGLPLSKVKVVQATTGGGFGGKEDTPNEFYSRCALLAWATKRPVRMVLERPEDVQMTSKRHPCRLKMKLGARRDGTFTALSAEIVGDAGAYATLTPVVMYRATVHAGGPYRTPNVHVDTYGVYTNRPPSGAFRGFGAPQAAIGCEGIVDVMAARLGIDPLELRLRNAVREGDTTPTGLEMGEHCRSLVAALETVRDASGWRERWRAPERPAAGGERYREGMGVAVIHYGNSLGAPGWYLDAAGAHLQVNRDGSVAIAIGHAEIGQGAITTLTLIAAEALGVDPGRIYVREVATDNIPDCGPTVASRATILSGNAILDAAAKIRAHLAPWAADLLKSPVEDVEFAADRARSKADPARSVGFAEVADHAFHNNAKLAEVGWWAAPKSTFDPETGQGSAYFQYSFAAHVARVRVDTLTGRTEVVEFHCAHDVGKAIYRAGLEGQVEGGVSQGVGYALLEDYAENAKGEALHHNFSTYILPGAYEKVPVHVHVLEYASEHGPYGVKSVGEPAVIPVAAAIGGALASATGLAIDHLPMTAERLRRRWLAATGEASLATAGSVEGGAARWR